MAQATVSAKRPARGAGLRRWLLPWTAGFQPSWIGHDLVAGIALGVVMIPQGMAYAELAGMPVVTGLYATMAATISYALLGSSRQCIACYAGDRSAAGDSWPALRRSHVAECLYAGDGRERNLHRRCLSHDPRRHHAVNG
jgi:hypothetical protein